MPAIVSGNKTALLAAITDLEAKIAALGTSYAAAVAALHTAKVLDDGGRYFTVQNPAAPGNYTFGSGPGLRLDDILSDATLARMAADNMINQGLRSVFELGWAKQEGTGVADIVALATTLLTGR